MRRNLKRIAVLAAVSTLASFLLAGCGGKTGQTSGGAGASDAAESEYVYDPEYISLEVSDDPNDYLRFYNADISDKSISVPRTVSDPEAGNIECFYDQFSLETGELISEVRLGDQLSQYLDLDSLVPEEYKDSAEKSIGCEYIKKLSNGKLGALLTAYCYVEPENPDDEWMSFNSSYMALFSSEGELEKFVPTEISDVLPGKNVNAQSLAMDAKGNIVVFFADWSEENAKYAVAIFDQDLNTVNKALVNANQIGNVVNTTDGKLYASVYDADWNSKFAEFNSDNCTFGEELSGLSDNDVSSIGMAEGAPDKLILNCYSKLCEYDLKEGTVTDVLKWIDVDIPEGNVSTVYKDAEGNYYAIVENYQDGTTEIVKLVYKKRSDVVKKREIVIASFYSDYDLKQMVVKFNKENPDYHVKIKEYFNYENEGASEDDALTTMINDIGGANSPDLINLEYLPVREYEKQGVFEDLTPYVESSSLVNLSDYNESVLNCFKYDGKMISIPRSYRLQTMVVSSKLFGDKKGWSVNDMIDYDLAHPESVIIDYGMRYYIMQICLYNNLDYFLNWDTGECKFETDEFKKILEYAASFPETIDWEAYDADSTSEPEKLANGSLISEIAYLYNLQSVQEYEDYLFAGEANFIGYPTIDGSYSTSLTPSMSCAICKNAKDKEAAWKFIEYLLSLKPSGDEFGFPANEKFLKEKIDEELKNNGKTGSAVGWGDGDMYEYHYATQEEIDEFYDILSAARMDPGEQNKVMAIIDEETQSYFNGQKTVDECAKIIQSRVSLYVQENM